MQAAEAAQTEAQVRVREAQTEFLLHWGPLAQLGDAQRASVIEQLAAGRQLLLRADLPGRHSLGTIPKQALVDVDGIRVPARVLGPLPQAAAHMQSVGLLLQMPHPPAGLGPSAQLPVMLEGTIAMDAWCRTEPCSTESRASTSTTCCRTRRRMAIRSSRRVPVTLLQPVGDGWLVTGLHAE